MYRLEQKFYHPAAIGFLVEDTLSDSEIAERIAKINKLSFERVGQVIGVNLICLRNTSDNKEAFIKLVSKAVSAMW